MSSRQERRAPRVRHTHICQSCQAVITDKHHFANSLFSVLCRGCFYKRSVA
jgi:hypothetical protein